MFPYTHSTSYFIYIFIVITYHQYITSITSFTLFIFALFFQGVYIHTKCTPSIFLIFMLSNIFVQPLWYRFCDIFLFLFLFISQN